MTYRSMMLAVAPVLIACSSGEAREAVRSPSGTPAAPTRIVDSILPPDEALRRFRDGLPEVTELHGGAPTRDALVDRFATALRTHDTTALRTLVLTRAEFAWLYYPTSVFSRAPYYQMPQLTWALNLADSDKGIARALERYGGPQIDVRGYDCADRPRVDGGMTFHDRCSVRLREKGTERRLRLFGSIAELRGQFKFYSYANDL